MRLILFVGLGGACGAVLRYLVSIISRNFLGPEFPYGTLIVNILGSFLIGWLTVLYLERSVSSPEMRGFLLVGLLGAFTTFSSFSLETLNLLESQQVMAAGVNITLNFACCITAVWCGLLCGRLL